MNDLPYRTPQSDLTRSESIQAVGDDSSIQKNRLPIAVLIVLAIFKLIALGWLIVGFFIFDVEDFASANEFRMAHQITYLIVSSALVVWIYYSARLPIIIFLLTIPINVFIYYWNGTQVTHSILDPILLTTFIFIVLSRKPNRWMQYHFNKKSNRTASPPVL